MSTAQAVLEDALGLTADDQRWLIAELEAQLMTDPEGDDEALLAFVRGRIAAIESGKSRILDDDELEAFLDERLG